ncbi:MAG: hypothetical protein AAGB29_10720 [Planctomycetota bacterium]
MPRFKYREKLAIWESNFGRSDGWILEVDGHPTAVLDDNEYYDMFWDSYRVSLLPESKYTLDEVFTMEFWCKRSLVYRSKATDITTRQAVISSGEAFPKPGRVVLRGLYISIGMPNVIDQCALAWRRYWTKR